LFIDYKHFDEAVSCRDTSLALGRATPLLCTLVLPYHHSALQQEARLLFLA
jgi:hypothetical protein